MLGLCHFEEEATWSGRRSDPLDRVQVGPVAAARLDRVPLAGGVLEPSSPFGDERAVLGMPGPVLGVDETEASLREQAERLGVVLHDGRLGRVELVKPTKRLPNCP